MPLPPWTGAQAIAPENMKACSFSGSLNFVVAVRDVDVREEADAHPADGVEGKLIFWKRSRAFAALDRERRHLQEESPEDGASKH